MNIREALLFEHSKSQTMKIVRYIDGDAVRFRELVNLFLGDNYRLGQRAALAVRFCVELQPPLINPYFSRFIGQLESSNTTPAVRRNVARLLQFVEIPTRYRGRAFEACYNLVDDGDQPVAVRAFAMSVAGHIARCEPDMLNELRLVVEKHVPFTTAGFRARARRIFSGK